VILLPALVMVAVSAGYYFLSAPSSTRRNRVLSSLHGVLAAVLYLGALAIWEVSHASRAWAAWPYLFLFVGPLASVAYALFRFTGPKLLHLTQLANLWGMLYAAFIGGMAITGDWL